MNILHVSAGIQETCGVSTFVMETVRAQMELGHRVCVVTSMTCGYPVGEVDVRLMPEPTAVDFQPDIVHLHSLWSPYVHKMAVWCRKRGIPYVISPHGTLTRWALRYKWWKKVPALILYQYQDLRKASAFHVTVPAEVVDVRRLGLRQSVTVAPLGVKRHPAEEMYATHNDILFLGRIHPVKNLDSLLKAWAEIAADARKNWRVIVAGPDDIGHQEELKKLANELGLRVRDFSSELEFGKKQILGGNEVPLGVYQEKLAASEADIVFTGPVYSETKDWLYRQSRYFVLPSHSENFGGVVLEALAAGTPCIASKGTPWRELEEHNCGWWVEDSVDALRNALMEAIEVQGERFSDMSTKARLFVRENYSWENTAKMLLGAYGEVILREGNKG